MEIMPNRFTISCALTTWNSNEYLEKQLDSLQNQTLPFDEVIIVDDASTNDTLKRLKAYIETHHLSHWKVIEHAANQGFVATFQDALKAATGDLIFLCDHDDLWYPDKVQIMTQQFDLRPNLQVLACSFDLIDGQDNQIADKVSTRRGNHNLIRKPVVHGGFTPMGLEDLTAYNFAPGCTLAFKKEIKDLYLNKAKDLDLPHDWAISVIGSLSGQLGYLDLPLIGYRQHEANTLGLSRRNKYEARKKAAIQEAHQKEALETLAGRFQASQVQMRTIRKTVRVYTRRAKAFENHNPLGLMPLFFLSMPSGFKLTLGMDLKTILESRGAKNEC